MKVTVVPGDRLSGEHVSLWSDMLRADASLDSPYFRPEFVEAVAAVRRDVAVAVLEEAGQPRGFFPFQRGRWKIGLPVGGPLSDFHGVVARRGADFDARQMVRACGLAAWRFDHLLTNQPSFRSHHRAETPSPFIDLSGGFDAYREARHRAGSRRIAQIIQAARAAERRAGPMRFEFHATQRHVFETLLGWKSRQYRQAGHTDVLAFRWVVELLDRIRQRQDEQFAGVLSALYLGDRLAAAHLGMRSRGVLHYWLPAYDPELARHSPGLICLMEIIKAAAPRGIGRIDLGKGMESYKSQLMTGAGSVAEGTVVCRPVLRIMDQVQHGARGLTRVPILGAPARLVARWSRSPRRRLMFR